MKQSTNIIHKTKHEDDDNGAITWHNDHAIETCDGIATISQDGEDGVAVIQDSTGVSL